MKSGTAINIVWGKTACWCLPVLFVLVSATSAMAAVITWDGSKNTAWTDPANWVGDVRPANSTSQDIARFADDATNVNNQATVNYGWAVAAVQFDGAGWTVGRSGTYTLNIGGGVTFNPVSAGSATFNSKLYLGASQDWDVAAGSTLNVNGGMGGASSTLTKTGAGRVVIRGGVDNINTFGAIVVSAGELLVTSGTLDQRLATVSVDSGALLGGAGTILRTVIINNGGMIEPGFFAAGTLTVGDLSLNDSSVLEYELETILGTNDFIVAEDVVLDGQLNVSDLGGLEEGTYTLITYSGTLTDNGLQVGTLPVGFTGNITTDSSGVYLNVIDASGVMPASIVSWSALSNNIMRMVVNAPDAASRYFPKATTNLTSGTWVTVPHSDDGANAFLTTNLSYSVAEGSNEVIYVKADDAAGFFNIVGQ